MQTTSYVRKVPGNTTLTYNSHTTDITGFANKVHHNF